MRVASRRSGTGPADGTTDTDPPALSNASTEPHAHPNGDGHADGHTCTGAPAHSNSPAAGATGIAHTNANEHCSAESHAHAGPDVDTDANAGCDSDA